MSLFVPSSFALKSIFVWVRYCYKMFFWLFLACYMLFHFLIYLTPHLHSSLYSFLNISSENLFTCTLKPKEPDLASASWPTIWAVAGNSEDPVGIARGQQGQAPGERLGLIPIVSQITSLDLDLARVFSIFKFSLKKYLSVITMHGIWRWLWLFFKVWIYKANRLDIQEMW